MRVRSRRPAPYLNGADQRRMLAMVGALALVLFAASWAANPANWYWIAPPGPAAETNADDAAPDFTVRENAPPPPGAVRVSTATPEQIAEEPDEDGRLPATLFAAAQDRKVGLTRAERDATAALLARLAETPPALPANADPTAFPGLMRDPNYYRGRPVRVFGEARGIVDLDEGRGVELWIFPPDSGGNPIRVVANRAEGLPRGERLREGVPVTADGVLFKLQGYAAQTEEGEGLHVAPLVLADEATRVTLEAAVPQTPAALPWVVLGVIAVALAGGGLLLWRWKSADRAFEQSTLNRFSAAADAEGERLNFAADDADPGAFLAGLSDGAPADGAPGANSTALPASEPTDSAPAP